MAAIKAYACFGSIRTYLHGPPGRETKTDDQDGMKDSSIFYKWLWQFDKGDLGGKSSFEIHGVPTIAGVRWKKWKRSLELFACGKGVTNAERSAK